MPPDDDVTLVGPTVCGTGTPVPERLRGAVVAIGNFDGVHLGHRRLIELAREAASRDGRLGAGLRDGDYVASVDGRPVAILTFEPHPRSYFRPDRPMFRITPEAEKLRVLARTGADGIFLRPFDSKIAETSARGFVDGLICHELGAAGLVVGPDFHFGRGREGNPDLLASLAAERGMTVVVADIVKRGGGPVSSSRIRALLEAGAVADANALLGYRWFVEGEVRHGEKRGRTLGFPTANVRLPDGNGLGHGIYAVRTEIAPGEVRDGVPSFGRRPTFDDGAPLLETYLFDFAGDLYGRRVATEFVGRIRGEERFDNADALVVRMRMDEAKARHLLASAPAEPPSLLGRLPSRPGR